MSADEMHYEELQAGGERPEESGTDLGRLQNVPVELAIEIGRTRMTIGEALALGPGSVVTVGRLAGDPVDLLVNGRVIARGEVLRMGSATAHLNGVLRLPDGTALATATAAAALRPFPHPPAS